MKYFLFIDDIRNPNFESDIEIKIARNSDEAISILKEFGIPYSISFDHDLGGDDTSIIYINALTDYIIDNNIKFSKEFKYYVHSQNPVGAQNIISKMDSLLKYFCE